MWHRIPNVVASYYSNIAQGYDDYGLCILISHLTVVDRGMKKPEDYNKQNVEDVEQKVNSQKQTPQWTERQVQTSSVCF